MLRIIVGIVAVVVAGPALNPAVSAEEISSRALAEYAGTPVLSQIEKLTSRKTFINVMEIKEPELDARLVAEAIAMQLERRIAHRRAIRRAMERTMQAGALGIKVQVKGRLGGSEIARREWQRESRVPLHTFSADIDYGCIEAHTTMGTILRRQNFV